MACVKPSPKCIQNKLFSSIVGDLYGGVHDPVMIDAFGLQKGYQMPDPFDLNKAINGEAEIMHPTLEKVRKCS